MMDDIRAAPQQELDGDLELDTTSWSAQDIYYLHSALVVPRPIAWVSTLSPKGVANLAPLSFFNAVCSDPPMVMFSVSGEKNTLINVRASGEFVVNFVTSDMAEHMELTAVDFPADESEFDWAGLEMAPSRRVAPPRVKETSAALECRVERIEAVGKRNHMVIAHVLHYFVKNSLWKNGRVDPALHRPLGRIGNGYLTLGEPFKLRRPALAEVRSAGKEAALALVDKKYF